MAVGIPHLRGFVLSHILREMQRGDIPSFNIGEPIDGFAESYVDNLEGRRLMASSPEAQRWFADGASFLGAVRTLILEEQVLAAPPG